MLAWIMYLCCRSFAPIKKEKTHLWIIMVDVLLSLVGVIRLGETESSCCVMRVVVMGMVIGPCWPGGRCY